MRVAICEDIPIVVRMLESQILTFDENIIIDSFFLGNELIAKIEEDNEDYDCLFLDIDLPDINGIEIAQKIRKLNLETLFVFITSHEEYMPNAFSVHTFDYLVKPIKQEQLYKVLLNVNKLLGKKNKSLEFTYNRMSYSIPIRDIIYLEKIYRKVKIITYNRDYYFYSNSKDLVDGLSDDFIRVHASFFVNVEYIVGYDSVKMILQDRNKKYEIPISRKYKLTAKKKMIEVFKSSL